MFVAREFKDRKTINMLVIPVLLILLWVTGFIPSLIAKTSARKYVN